MSELDFESRLGGQIRAYAQGGVRPIERFAIAQATAADRKRPGLASRRALILLVAAVIVGLVAAGAALIGAKLRQVPPVPPVPTTYDGVFAEAGAVPWTFGSGTLVTLADGRVLSVGGAWPDNVLASIWDPMTKRVSATGRPTTPRDQAVAVLLRDGRVLVMGGDITPDSNDPRSGSVGPPTAELYDPRSGTFRRTGPMQVSRWNFETALLADGRVLVTGGVPIDTYSPMVSAEIFDPTTATFSLTGSMTLPRVGHSMTVLADTRVLVVGGTSTGDAPSLTAAELYDPATGRFEPAPGAVGDVGRPVARERLDSARYLPWMPARAIILRDGRVLVPGDRCREENSIDDQGRPGGSTPIEGVIFDPSTGVSVPASIPHCVGTGTALPDGEVLLTGWWAGARWSGLFDPASGQTRETAAPPGGRYMTLVALTDGGVLVTAGTVSEADGSDILVQVFR